MEMFHQDMAMLLLHNNNNEGVDVPTGADYGGGGMAYNTNTNTNSSNSTSVSNVHGHPLKKGPWTAAEDAILAEYVRKHGEGNWNAVMRNSGLARCGKSCRLRWANHLRPNLKKGSFSHEEERLIVTLHAKYGNKWARMASRMPGRTDNEIKNYWNTRIKRRQRQGLPLYPPDVQPEHPQAQEQQLHSQKNHMQTLHQQYHQQQQHLQNCHSYLSHSQPSTPFTFQNNQFLTQSPTSGTPPLTASSVPATPITYSPLPSPNQSFSTLPLLDPFSVPRNPPLLSTSFRFRNHSFDTLATAQHQAAAPITTFSVPTSPISGYDAALPQPEAFSGNQFYRLPSFQFNSAPMVTNLMPESGYSAKFELPSNQFFSHNDQNSDLTYDTKVNISGSSNSGLLDDLLEETQAFSNGDSLDQLDLKEEHLLFNGFDDRNIGLV
ncbi:hypothetical protein ACFE04_007186 [Oxalis oulophora]